jgi:hypothetical protein
MSFFTAPTTAPPSTPELRCSRTLWEQLLANLRERGRFGERESGAFLIGCEMNKTRQISQFVLYDDLDQHSLDSGIVHFDGRYYGALWERCRAMNVMVVADIHTHPYGPQQSPSDRAHPMIATAGHIALILPRFAMGELSIEDIGMYLYLGGGRWRTVPAAERAGFLKIDDASGVPA